MVKEFKNSHNNNNQNGNTSLNYILEDLPPAENDILKINTLITLFSNKNNSLNKNEKNNEYNYSNEEQGIKWLFMNRDSNERFSISNYININNNIYKEEISCLEPDHNPFEDFDEITIKVSSSQKELESYDLKGFFIKTIYYFILVKIY